MRILLRDGLLEQKTLLHRQPGLYLATAEGLRWTFLQRLGAYRLSPCNFRRAAGVKPNPHSRASAEALTLEDVKTPADHTLLIAALATGAAIAAAIIAAASADVRQRRQLRHESDLQSAQLRHDRELQDLTELRMILDEASIAIEDVTQGLVDVFVGFRGYGPDGLDADDGHRWTRDELTEKFVTDISRATSARDKLLALEQRIAIRIGDQEPVYTALAGVVRVIFAIIGGVYREWRRILDGETVPDTAFDDPLVQLHEVRKGFVEAALAKAGSHLP